MRTLRDPNGTRRGGGEYPCRNCGVSLVWGPLFQTGNGETISTWSHEWATPCKQPMPKDDETWVSAGALRNQLRQRRRSTTKLPRRI